MRRASVVSHTRGAQYRRARIVDTVVLRGGLAAWYHTSPEVRALHARGSATNFHVLVLVQTYALLLLTRA